MAPEGLIAWSVLLGALTFLPFYGYLLLVSMAALQTRREPPVTPHSRHRFEVIIPAHDEEAGIASTVRSCLGQDYPAELFEVVVVADNCTDATASLARLEGARVVERSHPTDRSKGHALKFMFDRLRESGRMDELDAVVIIDADTLVDPHLLRTYDSYLERGHDWIQAFDSVANTQASWRTRLMTYSFALINGVLLRGQTALGWSAGLRGNGMCFSVRGMERCPWRTVGLVEDIEYSWSIRAHGETIAFAPEATVYATMLAEGGPAAATQRQRWEAGRRELKLRMLGPILRSEKLGFVERIAAIVELQMPTLMTLALFLLISTATSVCIFFNAAPGLGTTLPRLLMVVNAFSASALVVYGVSPFLLFPLPADLLISLAHFPTYAVWKLSMAFQKPPSRWIRTARESRQSSLRPQEPIHPASQ